MFNLSNYQEKFDISLNKKKRDRDKYE